MEIAPLDQRQIDEFLVHYYGDNLTTQQLRRTLRQRQSMSELLRVPFMLAVVTQLYRRQHRIIEDRLELYRQLLRYLVVQLDREKRLVRRDFHIPNREGRLKLDFPKYLACERLLIDEVWSEADGQEATKILTIGSACM